MRIIFLGTGSPTPRQHRAGASTLVMVGSQGLVVDLGPGATVNLVAAGVDPVAVTNVFFTHHHFDHNADYGHFVLARWDQGAGRGNELEAHGPPPTAGITDLLFGDDGVYGHDLRARTEHPLSQRFYIKRGGAMPRSRPVVRAQDLMVGDAVRGNGWTVRTGPARHVQPHLESLAYRVDAEAGSVVISGDTAPLSEMAELAQGAHTLIHMAMDLEAGISRWPEMASTCSGSLGAARIAADAGVRRLVLYHFGDATDTAGRVAAMVEEARSAFSGEVVAAKDRLELTVEPS